MSNENSSSKKPEPTQIHGQAVVPLPRVTIRFCVQCKWNLRAAYYAQELLQTFSLSLGEIALIPSTSGTFIISLLLPSSPQSSASQLPPPPPLPKDGQDDRTVVEGGVMEVVLWDRKIDGGFPETKELKRRVRDLVVPGRGLGHVDRDYGKSEDGGRDKGDGREGEEKEGAERGEGRKCEDCA